MWFERNISKHPIYFGIIAFILVFIPEVIQLWWGFFSSEPIIPTTVEKLKKVNMPNISFAWLYWITIPMGLGMLGYIVYLTKKADKTNREQDINATFIDFNPNAFPLAILKSQNISGTIWKSVTCKDYSIFTFTFSEPLENEDYKVRPVGTSNLEYELYGRTCKSFNIKFEEPCPDLVRLEFML